MASADRVSDIDRAGFSAPTGEDAIRLQHLARVIRELGAAEDLDAIAQAAVGHLAVVIRAAAATLLVRDGDRLRMVAGDGLGEGVAATLASLGLHDVNPASEAARTGETMLFASPEEVDSRYESLRGTMPPGRSLVCLPLGSGGNSIGAIGLTFDDGWLPGPHELNFLTSFSEACGQAIRRVRASQAEQEHRWRIEFLAQASVELASSLDYRQTLARVAQLMVPTVADWCAVQIVSGDELETVAVAHVDPDKVAWAWELQKRYPTDVNSPTGAPNVIRTGHSEIYAEITDEMLVAGAVDDEHLRLSRELDPGSAMIVPLNAHNRTLGAITVLRTRSGRRYETIDLRFAEDLGRRAAISLDNALLHRQVTDVARQLQEVVLPDDLSSLPGWQVSVHYEPGGSSDVGGDFYDAVPLPDGRLALFIGDVMGHGLTAAAAMAQMRAATRAYVVTDPEPAVVLAKLDAMFDVLGMTGLVTLAYSLVDPAANTIRTVNAGHYSPLLVSRDGSVRWLTEETSLPLGAGPASREAIQTELRPDDILFLYTDGLVERRGEIIDRGLDRLIAAAGALAGPDQEDRLAHLVAEVSNSASDDDVTALVVRRLADG